MKGIGLVFAGGGGKGAYEIGVWKYLHEVGLDHYVRAVSGTSVGALNAALFVGSNYDVAEDLWMNISNDKILSPKKISIEDVLEYLSIIGLNYVGPIGQTIKILTSGAVSDASLGMSFLSQYILRRITSDNFFSRDGLVDLIKEGIRFTQLQNSIIPCFVTCFKCMTLSVERFDLKNYSEAEIVRLLLASSAIPVIFPYEEFKGNIYCDGGIPLVGDNVPIQPIYDMGVEHILVIHLNQDSLIDKDKYNDSKIIEIKPSVDLGNALNGVLDFSPEGAKIRINQGYIDAMRILQPMIELIKMSALNQAMLRKCQDNMKDFYRKKKNLDEVGERIKSKIKNDGFNEMRNSLRKDN